MWLFCFSMIHHEDWDQGDWRIKDLGVKEKYLHVKNSSIWTGVSRNEGKLTQGLRWFKFWVWEKGNGLGGVWNAKSLFSRTKKSAPDSIWILFQIKGVSLHYLIFLIPECLINCRSRSATTQTVLRED